VFQETQHTSLCWHGTTVSLDGTVTGYFAEHF